MRWSAFAVLLLSASCACTPTPPTGSCATLCVTPPATACLDAHVLRSWTAPTACADTCDWLPQDRTCTDGCRDGQCTGPVTQGDAGQPQADAGQSADAGTDAGIDACAAVHCNSPPARVCASNTQLRVYEASGSCANGACSYASTLQTCAQGCAAGACIGDPCQGVTCQTPPVATCSNSTTLKTFSAAGTCTAGACGYTQTDVTCQFGCAAGACVNDPCAGQSCAQPPAAYCASATVRRTFANPGTCAGGSCAYASMDTTCQFGCVNGTCANDPCAGVACSTPPAATCLNATTRRTFGATGTCAGGGCTYAPTDTTCQFGCAAGACNANPCTGVTCASPPAATCVNSTTARQYGASGTCSGSGTCTYAPVDTACTNGCTAGVCNGPTCGATQCNTPPANTCTSSRNLRSSSRLGTCSGTTCSYQSTVIECSEGCFNGACIAGSWQRETLPYTSSSTQQLWPQFAVDSLGNQHVTMCANNGVDHWWKDDFGWHTETVDPAVATYATCIPSLALDHAGNPGAAWYDSANGDLRYGHKVNGAWVKELIATTGDVGQGSSITFDANDLPVVAYWNRTLGEVRVARRSSTAVWTSEVAVPSGPGVGATTPITEVRFGPDQKLYVVAGEALSNLTSSGSLPGQGDAWLAVRETTGWVVRSLGAFGVVGRRTLGFDADGAPMTFHAEVAPGGPADSLYVSTLRAGVLTKVNVNNVINFREQQPLVAKLDGPTAAAAWNASNWFTRRNGVWDTSGLTRSVIQPYDLVRDFANGVDGKLRLYMDDDTIVTETPCAPSCTGRACGEDTCGGTCGACPGTNVCTIPGVCSGWQYEAVTTFDVARSVLRIGSNDVVQLVYVTGMGTQYTTKQGVAPWSAPVFVTNTGYPGEGNVALTAGNAPVVSTNNNGTLVVSTWNGTAFTTVNAASAASTEGPALAVSATGKVHVLNTFSAWTGSTNNPNGRLDDWSSTGGAFSATTLATLSGTGNLYAPSIAVEPSGTAHATWLQSNGTVWNLMYANNSTGAFVATIAKANATTYPAPIVRVDSTGRASLLTTVGGQLTWGQRSTAGAWTWETLPTGAQTPVPQYALDRAGTPVVVGAASTVPATMFVARRTAANTWAVETVPSYSGVFTSTIAPGVAFETNGTTHLTFSDGRVLRHAWR